MTFTAGRHYTGRSARPPRTECCARNRSSRPVSGSRARCTWRAGPGSGAGARPRVVALCFVAVITLPGEGRPELDDQVPPPQDPGGEAPGTVPVWRAWPICGGEAEPGPTGRVWSAGSVRFVPFSGGGGCRPGAAVPDGVPLAIGDRHAPGRAGLRAAAAARSRARSGSMGPIPPISPGWRRPDLRVL